MITSAPLLSRPLRFFVLALGAAHLACGTTIEVGDKIEPPTTDPRQQDGSGRDNGSEAAWSPKTDAPAAATASDPVVQVAAGSVNTCARHASGAVSCWGYGFGPTPVRVPSLKGAVHLAGGNAGGFFQCAAMSDGALRCLDASQTTQTSQTAAGASAPLLDIHDEAGPITDAIAITIGESAACVRRRSGKVSCTSPWQPLADKTTWPTVRAFEGAVDVHAGTGRVCAVRADDVFCMGEWRYATYACAGAGASPCACDAADPSCAPEHGPFRVLTRASLHDTRVAGFVSVRTSWDATAIVDQNGNVFWWGFDAAFPTRAGQNQIWPEDARLQRKGVVAFDMGGGTTCESLASDAPSEDGRVSCWGDNARGQAGHALATGDVPMPVVSGYTPVAGEQTPTLVDVIGVSVGLAHACAWSASAVHCWGLNEYGQVGDGTTANARYKAKPITFPAPTPPVTP